MHLYVLTRGVKNLVDAYINDLQAMRLTYAKGFIQFGVRPIQLWEMAFPKEHLKTVLSTVCPQFDNLTKQMHTKKEQFLLNRLGKLLGANKIPKMDLRQEPRRIVSYESIGIYPFGIREDANFEKGNPYGDGAIGREQV